MPIRGVLMLVFFAISLPICFVRPFYGIVLWTIVAFVNPQQYSWIRFPVALAVAVPTVIGFFIFCRGWFDRLRSKEVLLMILLWVWFTITSLVSVDTPIFQHHAADTWARWEFVSKVMLMTVVTIGVVDSFSRLRMLIITIGASFAVFILKALPFMILTGGVFRLYGPQRTMIADNNDFGLALNMTLPLYFFLARTESRRWAKWIFAFLFVVTIPAIFFTYSRGALVGLTVIMGLMFLQLKRRMILIPVIALAAMIALLFAPAAWKERMDPSRPDAIDASARSRLNAWTYSWRLATDYPIAGGGFDTFTRELFDRYAPNPLDVHGPHSVYFGVLAEHGFIGLFMYLTLLYFCFSSARHVVKWARLRGQQIIADYGNMFRFSLIGFAVAGTFLGRAYFDYFFTIVACIVVLKQLYRFEETPSLSQGITAEEAA